MTTTAAPRQAFARLEHAVGEAHKALAEGLWQLPDAEVAELVRGHHALLARLESLRVALITEARTRSLPAAAGASSPQAWLSQLLALSPAAALAEVRVAEALAERLPDAASEYRAGRICSEQARALVHLCDGLPVPTGTGARREVEQAVLAAIAESGMHAGQIRTLATRVHAIADPDGPEPRETRAAARRTASIRDLGDRRQRLTVDLHEEAMATVKAALDPLTAPAPAADGSPDPRSGGQRRADALVELAARVLRRGDLPAGHGQRPQLIVTIPAALLHALHRVRAGATPHDAAADVLATTATAEQLCGETVRRLACDAKITALILDPAGVPLAMSRTTRTVTAHQWKALLVRDRGCTFPDCTRPATWCQPHHRAETHLSHDGRGKGNLIHWSAGGPTDLTNLALLCHHHHEQVHHGGWTVRIGPDGHPEYLPPPWIDPQRTPRRNTYWRALDQLALHLSEPDPEPEWRSVTWRYSPLLGRTRRAGARRATRAWPDRPIFGPNVAFVTYRG